MMNSVVSIFLEFSFMEYCSYYVQFAIEINGRLRLVSLSQYVVYQFVVL